MLRSDCVNISEGYVFIILMGNNFFYCFGLLMGCFVITKGILEIWENVLNVIFPTFLIFPIKKAQFEWGDKLESMSVK